MLRKIKKSIIITLFIVACAVLTLISGCHPWRIARVPDASAYPAGSDAPNVPGTNSGASGSDSDSEIPPFSSEAVNTGEVYTNSVFGSAALTMVNIWATTCGPCKKELPEIAELADDYSERGLRVLTVLGDSEVPGAISEALAFFDNKGIMLPVLRNNSSVAAAFPSGSYPITYFVDSNGKILKVIKKSNDYDGWAGLIDALMPQGR